MNGYSEICSQRYKITCHLQSDPESDPESDPDPPLSLPDSDAVSGSGAALSWNDKLNPEAEPEPSELKVTVAVWPPGTVTTFPFCLLRLT